MSFLMKYVDVYDLRARVLPALLCVMPAPLVLWSFYGNQANWWTTGVSIAVTCGFVFLLSRVARDAGQRIQGPLWQKWGGPPTTQLLRHGDNRIDRHTKAALHARLGRLCGVSFPTSTLEAMNSRDADDAYEAGARWLREHTRDTARFALLFKENINYGFQRNALGLRWIGLALALAGALSILAKGGVLSLARPYLHVDRLSLLTPVMALSLGLCIVLAAIWLFAVTPAACKRTAFAYSERLLETASSFD
jgi:hypothetical protein